jgi:prephenate dehydrogenase/chorismate mutase
LFFWDAISNELKAKKGSSDVFERSSSSELEHLRRELYLVTQSILRLAKKRQDLARDIAEIKKGKANLPIENLAVEEKLKESLSTYASQISLDKGLALEITNIFLNYSKIAQRERMFRDSIVSFLERNGIKTVLIVGAGRMGGWFSSYFKELGRKVFVFDKRLTFANNRARELGVQFARDLRAFALKSDLIFVAVPISETIHMIAKLEEICSRKTSRDSCKAIIEVSSIKPKISLEKDLVALWKIPIIRVHPLFGAYAPHFGLNTILVVRSKAEKENSFTFRIVRALFPQFQVFGIRNGAHDKQMALMLSLPHALALAFGHVIMRNRDFIGNKKAITPSFSTLREFASKVLSENPDVYYEIESENRFTPLVLRDLVQSITIQLGYFESREGRQKFKKFFQDIRSQN